MTSRRLLLACALLAAAAAAAACRGPDWRVAQLFGGATSIDVLTNPQKVEAFRLDPRTRPAEGAAKLGDYAVVAGPVEVDAAAASELSAVFLDPGTYDWLRAKGCDFMPGVGLRFVKDASRLDVALCFECDELMAWRMGKRVGVEDFDVARPRLVAVAKRLFPDDAKIQALE